MTNLYLPNREYEVGQLALANRQIADTNCRIADLEEVLRVVPGEAANSGKLGRMREVLANLTSHRDQIQKTIDDLDSGALVS